MCERARQVAQSKQGLPRRETNRIERTSNGHLHEVTRDEVSWKLTVAAMQGTSPDFWTHVAELSNALAADPGVAAATGVPPHTDQRATHLWLAVLAPLFERYARRQPDLDWNPQLARDLVKQWRARHGAGGFPHQTIAPLHNLRGSDRPVTIDPDTSIRALTDDDRDDLWRHFGAGGSTIRGLSLGQLDAWTDAIDLRWDMPTRPPYSYEIAAERIRDVVTALRLHHPGVTGTTILWTRLDPDDAPAPSSLVGQTLSAPLGDTRFMHPLRTTITPEDGPELRTLVQRIVTARGTRNVGLAIRRFNSAYERRNTEDALIDLWVAFEALVVPDSMTELKYRAALRIGRLGGQTGAERQAAFDLARRSYDARSKVVHGGEPPGLDGMVVETRGLARAVLRQWVLHPIDDITRIERALLGDEHRST